MITPKFFERYCKKLFACNCEIKTEQSKTHEQPQPNKESDNANTDD